MDDDYDEFEEIYDEGNMDNLNSKKTEESHATVVQIKKVKG